MLFGCPPAPSGQVRTLTLLPDGRVLAARSRRRRIRRLRMLQGHRRMDRGISACPRKRFPTCSQRYSCMVSRPSRCRHLSRAEAFGDPGATDETPASFGIGTNTRGARDWSAHTGARPRVRVGERASSCPCSLPARCRLRRNCIVEDRRFIWRPTTYGTQTRRHFRRLGGQSLRL
jgi:hypothetical protein